MRLAANRLVYQKCERAGLNPPRTFSPNKEWVCLPDWSQFLGYFREKMSLTQKVVYRFSWKAKENHPRMLINHPTKNEVSHTYGLGGDSEHTDTHTHRDRHTHTHRHTHTLTLPSLSSTHVRCKECVLHPERQIRHALLCYSVPQSKVLYHNQTMHEWLI